MILLNFSHPITPGQLEQVRALIGSHPEGTGDDAIQVVELPVQFDVQQPFEPQVQDVLARLPLSSTEIVFVKRKQGQLTIEKRASLVLDPAL